MWIIIKIQIKNRRKYEFMINTKKMNNGKFCYKKKSFN